MSYFRFINRRLHLQNNREWYAASTVVPYCDRHRQQRGRLGFVARHLFTMYCDAPRKLSKFYWRMHPDQHPWSPHDQR